MATVKLSSSEESSGKGGRGNEGVSSLTGSKSSSSFIKSIERVMVVMVIKPLYRKIKRLCSTVKGAFVYGGVIVESAE